MSRMEEIEQVLCEIQKNPLQASTWCRLGEFLLARGQHVYARKILGRASILDPENTIVETLLHSLYETIASLKTVQPEKSQKNNTIEAILQTRPVTVTAGLLVKNEEDNIGRCLSSLIDAVDEIVVIDTGSTDRTIEIVKTFPKVKMVEFPWCDDFSAARNFGFPYMTSDWVIWVDADEYLHPDDIEAIRTVAAIFQDCSAIPILRIGQLNHIGDSISTNYNQARMFPLRHDLRYQFRVHEQIHLTDTDSFFSTPVRIRLHHDGYEPTVMQTKNKLQRNITLLQRTVEEHPNNPTPLLFLGRETLGNHEVDRAIEILTRAEEAAKRSKWFGRTLEIYKYLIHAYFMKADLDKAEEICQKALQIKKYFPDALYALACIQKERALRLCVAAEEHAFQAKTCFDQYRGNTSADNQILDWKSDLLVADLSLLYGNLPKAKLIYKEILTKRPNMESVTNQLEYIETVRKELNRISV